jgi:hypothetical protein
VSFLDFAGHLAIEMRVPYFANCVCIRYLILGGAGPVGFDTTLTLLAKDFFF